MNPALDGQWFRGESIPYSLSAGFPVKLDFLANARQFSVPEVTKIAFVITGTDDTTGGGTTSLGRDFAKLFDQIQFQDESEMIKASGAMLRILRQVELGAKATDPADNANASVQMNRRLEIILESLDTRALRPRDFSVPLENFLEGGQLTFNSPAAVPTGYGPVNADWRVRVEMKVRDGRVKELKSRRRIYEQVVQQQEFDYPANGSLRNVILGSKLATTGYTSLAAFVSLYSRTLMTPPNFSVTGLTQDYTQGADVIGANDEFLLAAPGAIALKTPRRAQKIGHMINAKVFHLDLLQAAPASGRLLLDMVVDRTPNLSATTMGYQSPGDLATAMKQIGYVIGETSSYKASQFNADLVRRLPIRLYPNGAK